jgi:PPM family protein phosphatase
MLIRYHGYTDVGKKRSMNEDHYVIDEKVDLACVCDGMGGHKAGALASQLAVETLRTCFHRLESECIESICSDIDHPVRVSRRLIASVRMANRRVYNWSRKDEDLSGMGSTMIAVHLYNNHLMVCHVGDSRLYRFRDGRLSQLTSDHSWVNELLMEKEITEQEARNFRQKNVITRALGIRGAMRIDWSISPILKDDIYLICSDGVSGVINDQTLSGVLGNRSLDLRSMIRSLSELANGAGSPDNLTIVLAEVMEANRASDDKVESCLTLKEEGEDIQRLEDGCLKTMFRKKSWLSRFRRKNELYSIEMDQ